MRHPRVILPLLHATLLSLAAPAVAGLPQPPIHLSGRVTAGGTLITEGQLVWKYTLSNGKVVEVATSLRPTADAELPLSYSVLIPVERIVEAAGAGLPSRAVGLQLSRTPIIVERSATLDGRELRIVSSQYGARHSINQRAAMASFEIVDLGLAFAGADCCRGDSDGDRRVEINDFLTTTNWFGNGETALGDANCDFFTNVSDYVAIREEFGRACNVSIKALVKTGVELEAKLSPSEGIAEFEFAPPLDAIRTGDEVVLPLLVSTGKSPLWLAGSYIYYDPGALEFVAGQPGKPFAGGMFTGTPQVVAPGVIAFSAGSAGVTGTQVLATLTFRALGEGPTVIAIGTAGEAATRALDSAQGEMTILGRDITLVIHDQPTTVRDWRALE